jgi:TonB family protein
MPGAFEHIEERVPASERRSHSRQPVRTLAYVELDEGNGGIVLNASEGGLSVQAVMSLMEDSLPRMRFQLSQSNDWLETSARVAWTNESRKVAGLQFVDPPEATLLHIRQWLAGEATGADAHESREPAAVPGHAVSATGKERATIDAITPPPEAAPPTEQPPAAAAQLLGQTTLFQASGHSPKKASPETERSDRAWNLAGIVALLAVASLAAGWIAGRGTFDNLWSNIRGTPPTLKTPQPILGPVSAGTSEPISQIETVDLHNQRWTIPFDPAETAPTGSHGKPQSQQWPAFNPDATTPEIESRPAADNAASQEPNPPEVTSPSDDGGNVALPSESVDVHDLPPPEPKAALTTTQPASALQRGALIYHVNPVYPDLAKQQGVQGTVGLQVTIGETGAVRSVIAVSGPGLLIEAARNAVRQWRYTPSLLNGKPVETQEYVSVVFQLPSSSK